MAKRFIWLALVFIQIISISCNKENRILKRGGILGTLGKKPDKVPEIITEKDKKLFVEAHNSLRGQVSPPAANMQYMQWDDTLARIAQNWANKCIWKHGNVHIPFLGLMGQNMYAGYKRNPQKITKTWFDEHKFYNYSTRACQPKKMCGHYTQVVWAESLYVGCGIKTHCWPRIKYLVVCNYSPVGNYRGLKPYKTGTPCSQCPEDAKFCYKNVCVTESQCRENNLECDLNPV